MEEIQKKIGRRMGIMMAITMSFCASLAGTISSGHFTVVSWLISFAISSIVSILIGLIIPMKKISDAIISKLKLVAGKLPAKLISSLISTIIFTPLMVLVVTAALSYPQANKGIDNAIAEKQKEIDATTQQITEVQQEIASMSPSSPAYSGKQQQLGGLSGKKEGLTNAIKDIEAGRPSFLPMYLRSLGISMIVVYIASFIFQPIYLKLTFKHYKIDA